MNRNWSKQKLDSLLGRGGIGASRRDAILDKVLARVKSEAPPRFRWRWPLAGLASLAAATAALLLLLPRFSPSSSSLFRAKGAATKLAAAPSTTIECLGGTLGACPIGSLLVVRVSGARGYVSAWAIPAGGGERIWYFSADTFSPLLDATSVTSAVATRAVKIGPEHVPGAYIVQLRLTEQPMMRADLLHAPASSALVAEEIVLTISSQ
jgi:hypothetical protein